MRVCLNRVAKSSGIALTTALLSVLLGGVVAQAQTTRDFTRPLTAEQKLHHTLNRLTFGARLSDVERVRVMGLNRWIEAQLSPETINNKPLEDKLSALKALDLPSDKLMLAQSADNGQFQKKLRELQQQQSQGNKRNNIPATPIVFTPQEEKLRAELEAADLELQTSYQVLGELQLDKITRAIESERQLYEIMVDFWSNHFNLDVKKNAVRVLKVVDEREVIRPHVFGSFRDMLGASAKSPAMLVYLDNASSTREREMNAPRGRRMRGQNQQVAAMPNMPATPAPVRSRGGINENYARELMELHTLGVDGGYTQQDVQNVARCFTGWSLDRKTGQFLFRRSAHDEGEKTVLGQTIPANGGISDGEKVLDILATHPATAKFIARKLCVRLVADEPPATLVDKAVKSFTATNGDLRAVVKTIVTSPEFFSTGAYRAKIKSPFEYAVSAVRAMSGVVLMPDTSVRTERQRLIGDGYSSGRGGGYGGKRTQKTMAISIGDMGQPLYSYQAPTGYSEDSRNWVSTGALVSRLNYALALVGNDIYNVVTASSLLLKGVDEHDHAAMVERLAQTILNGDMSAGTRATLTRETASPGAIDRNKLTALVLGSPEFQRR